MKVLIEITGKMAFVFLATAIFLTLNAGEASAHPNHGSQWIGVDTPHRGYTYLPEAHRYSNDYSYGINGWGAYSIHYNYKYRYPYYAYRNPYFGRPAYAYYPYAHGPSHFW